MFEQPRLKFDSISSDAAIRPPTSGRGRKFTVSPQGTSVQLTENYLKGGYVNLVVSGGTVWWHAAPTELQVNPLAESGPMFCVEARDGTSTPFLAPKGDWWLNMVAAPFDEATVVVSLYDSDASKR